MNNPFQPRTGSRRLAVVAVAVLSMAVAAIALAAVSQDTSGVDREIGRLEDQIAAMRDAGLDANDPKIKLLQAEIDSLLEVKQDPGPPPVPESVVPEPGLGAVESAETDCEVYPGITDPIEDWSAVRCVSVAQKDLDALVLFLTPEGWALATSFHQDASGVSASKVEIPVLPDLKSASIAVDSSGAVHVTGESGETVIPTDGLG